MPIFNEIGKKITQTGQGAVQKTKIMAETVRLNGQISDEEKKINGILVQIGKLYCEKYSDNPEAEFIQQIGEIKEARVRINLYVDQINQIKGIVKCPKCGGDMPNNALFCSLCGSDLSEASRPVPEQSPAADGIVCQGCGAIAPVGTSFCTNCGKQLS